MPAKRMGRSRWLVLPVVVALSVGVIPALTTASAGADSSATGGDFWALPSGSRVVDTRSGTGVPKAKLTAGQTVSVTVLGHAGVPSSGVKSLLLHATAIGPSAHSSLIFWPHGQGRPLISSLNVPASTAGFDATIEVAPGSGGQVDISNGGGTLDLVVDVAGYFTTTTGTPGHGGYVPLAAPIRAVDTRSGAGGVPKAKIAAGKTVTATIPQTTIPANVSAFYAEITVPGATANTTLLSYPGGGASSAGLLAVTPTGTGTGELLQLNPNTGQIVFANSSTAANDVVVDIEGYYAVDPTQGADLHPLQTRLGGPITIPSGGSTPLRVAGGNGLPTRGITSALLNITLSGQTAPGLLTVSGAAGWAMNAVGSPSGSFHNSLVMVPLSAGGTVTISNPTSTSEVVYVDSAGYYSNNPDTSIDIVPGAPMTLTQAVAGGPIDATYVDNSGTLWHGSAGVDALDQANWSTVNSNLEALTGRPALVKLSPSTLEGAVLHARDGEVWTFTVPASTAGAPAQWSPTFVHTSGIMTGSPAAANLPDGTVVIFDIDADGALWALPTSGGWFKVSDTGSAGSPTAVSTTSGIQVVVRTRIGTVRTALYSNGVLGSWTDLAGTDVVGDVAAMMNQGPRLRIVAGQADGTVVSKLQNLNGTFPTAWTELGTSSVSGTFYGSPAIALDSGSGTTTGTGLSVVWMRNAADNRLYQSTETGVMTGQWSEWSLVAGQQPDQSVISDASMVQISGSANNYHWLAGYRSTGGPAIGHTAN